LNGHSDPVDERLVNRSRHVGGLIEVSGTEDDLSSMVGVIADEVTDESGARRRNPSCWRGSGGRVVGSAASTARTRN
jgi:hypothetical protein